MLTQDFEYFFIRARTMMISGLDKKSTFNILLREGAPYDYAYFAVKGAQMAIEKW